MSGTEVAATQPPQPRTPLVIAAGTGPDTDVPAVQRFNPYAPGTARGTPPRLYQHLLGYPGDGKTLSPDVVSGTGPPGLLTTFGSAVTEAAMAAALGGGQASTMAITVSWFAAHLTGERRR